MVVFPGPLTFGLVDPCANSPTISSVGTAAVDEPGGEGQCNSPSPDVNVIIGADVTISASLPAGAEVQARALFGNSTGSYTSVSGYQTVSGWTGTSDRATATIVLNEYGGGILGNTRYYALDVRIVGTDGSTVCDGPDRSGEGSDDGWTDCP